MHFMLNGRAVLGIPWGRNMADLPESVILVVEDDRQIRLLLARILTAAGFATTVVASAAAARAVIGGLKPNLVVLDIGLPGEDGFSLEGWLRKRHPGTAILILSGRATLADRVKGLDGGADDYVAKPFMADELIARIRSIIRRTRAVGKPDTAECPTFMDASLDAANSCLRWHDGRTIHLTVTEFAILATMAARPGRVAHRPLLLDRIGADEEVGTRSVDYHVCQLRAKLKKGGVAADAIHAIRGVGYVYRPRAG